MKRLLLGLLGLQFFVAAGRTDDAVTRLAITARDIDKSLGTEYYGVYLLGKKVGYAQMGLLKIDDQNAPVFRESFEMNLKLISANVKSEMKIAATHDFDGKPPYAFRGGRTRETDGNSIKEITLTRASGNRGFDVALIAGGDKSDKRIAAFDYTLTDALTPSAWLRRGPKVGDRVATRSFDFDELRMDHEVRKLIATKSSLAGGVKTTYHEVEVTLARKKITGFERYDEHGDKVLSMRLAGIFEIRLEPEKQAKNTEYSADLFVLGSVKIDRPLGNPSELEGLVIEVSGEGAPELKPGPRQAVTNQDGRIVCKLGRRHGVSAKPTAADLEEALADTPIYPINHPRVRALAQEAVGDAKTPKEKVERLVAFVNRYVEGSNAALPLSLLKLLNEKKGDCKSYALLFTTLSRASGIPARDLGGLVYMGDDQKTFGGHAWNEVVLDGVWTPVDASSGEVEINPTHISLGPVRGDGMMAFMASLGKLSFKLVEVERRKP